MKDNNLQLATFGGGCFWCIEAVFNEIKGVKKVVSGYSGGNVPGKPTYKEICSGLTGHAEVIQITFDANTISYKDLVLIFMTSHDPTTLNQQGADRGTQYKSVIYYHDELQNVVAKAIMLKMAEYYYNPIVTELSPMDIFYEAEKEHQEYYKNNQSQSYCSFVIAPKLSKLRKMHKNKLKDNL